jgi:hypothetical protein
MLLEPGEDLRRAEAETASDLESGHLARLGPVDDCTRAEAEDLGELASG